jgi:alpha-ketoglutarate-dependent taurine dioxygenase
LIKIPPVGGDTMFSNMELAWNILDEKIKENILDEKIKEKIKNKQKRLDFTSRCQWIENVLAIWGNRRVIYQV